MAFVLVVDLVFWILFGVVVVWLACGFGSLEFVLVYYVWECCLNRAVISNFIKLNVTFAFYSVIYLYIVVLH